MKLKHTCRGDECLTARIGAFMQYESRRRTPSTSTCLPSSTFDDIFALSNRPLITISL
jgi:hypothetical protein